MITHESILFDMLNNACPRDVAGYENDGTSKAPYYFVIDLHCYNMYVIARPLRRGWLIYDYKIAPDFDENTMQEMYEKYKNLVSGTKRVGAMKTVVLDAP